MIFPQVELIIPQIVIVKYTEIVSYDMMTSRIVSYKYIFLENNSHAQNIMEIRYND
jgi:hypothetical protein